MIAGLILIIERDEGLRAFEAFKSAFAAGAAKFPNHVVSVSSGSFQVDVYWHRSAGVWGGFRCDVWDPPNKEWMHIFGNSFGVEVPSQQGRLNMTVEINPPHEGIRRTAGVFLRDESGLYVGHDGRLGGRGFKQAEFREFAQAQGFEWQEIGGRKFVVFGPLQDSALLLDKLARYVRTVAQFKASVGARR